MQLMITWKDAIDKGYLIAHGKVYNPDGFSHFHPRLDICIKNKSQNGQDCSFDYDMHSTKGKKKWNKLYVGKLQPNLRF
jgi:cytochrome b involved in lipid metabolism